MATWKNLDTLASYSTLNGLKDHVNIAEAMSGEQGAERVKKYSVPMAAGLAYNYAAKEVDETVLDALSKLADEAELIEKFQELYNGAVINTGEKRMVLHHLARTQLGEPVVVDGVDKREFYVAQQKKAADFANKVHKLPPLLFRLPSILNFGKCIYYRAGSLHILSNPDVDSSNLSGRFCLSRHL